MQNPQKYNQQIEINDLINDAINNAVARRGLVETISNDEATKIAGGLRVTQPLIAGYKTIFPPTKPEPKPIFPPIKPPIIAGMIPLPDDKLPGKKTLT